LSFEVRAAGPAPVVIAADIADLRSFPDDPIYDLSPPNPCEGGGEQEA
jgi:hypothetical protein